MDCQRITELADTDIKKDAIVNLKDDLDNENKYFCFFSVIQGFEYIEISNKSIIKNEVIVLLIIFLDLSNKMF